MDEMKNREQMQEEQHLQECLAVIRENIRGYEKKRI